MKIINYLVNKDSNNKDSNNKDSNNKDNNNKDNIRDIYGKETAHSFQ